MANNRPAEFIGHESELIRRHSTRIKAAQKELREAIRAAEQDKIREEQLYV